MKIFESESLKTGLRVVLLTLFSALMAYLWVKQYYFFTLILILLTVLACINWPFFSVWLISWFAIVQPGLFDETLNSFVPFLLFSAATLLSWFLGFTNRKLKECAWNAQTLFIFVMVFAETIGTYHLSWFQYTIEVFMLWIRIFLVYFLVASLVQTNRQIRLIMWATGFAVVFIALYALNIYFICPEEMVDGRLAAYGMYDNPNDLALIMVVIWPILFKLFEIEKSPWVAVIIILMMLVITLTLVLTVSRGGLMGLAAVGMLCLWTFSKLSKRQRILIVACSLMLFVVAAPVILSQRGEESGFDAEDESASDRIDAWRAGGRILLAYPIGIGFNTFTDFVGSFGGPNNLMAHNTPVKVAAESGFIGLFCYLGTLFLTLKKLIFYEQTKEIKSQPITLALMQGLRIAIIGFMVNTTFSVKEHEWMLYIVLGLAVAMINKAENELKLAKNVS